MYYYKIIENEKLVSLEKRSSPSTDDAMIAITEEEYNETLAELNAQYEAESEAIAAAEQSKDERIAELEAEKAELEAENAALLYQVLTGEELADV